MKKSIVSIMLVIVTLVSGCSHNAMKVTGDPKKTITLEAAFRAIGTSLKALEEEKGDSMLGIGIHEISVEFNISSKATDDNSVGIAANPSLQMVTGPDYSPKLGELLGTRLNAETKSHVEGIASNKVTVKLVSLPMLINGLSAEQLALLSRVGYFGEALKQTNNSDNPEEDAVIPRPKKAKTTQRIVVPKM